MDHMLNVLLDNYSKYKKLLHLFLIILFSELSTALIEKSITFIDLNSTFATDQKHFYNIFGVKWISSVSVISVISVTVQ